MRYNKLMHSEPKAGTRNILIIDDDEFLLDMYSLKFREQNFNVEIAFSGNEAFEKIKNGFLPDIILLDIIMPQMDGFEFLRLAKAEGILGKTKVIILTNLGQKEDIEKGMSLGASDYIIKAYLTPSEVVKKVNAMITGGVNGKK